jgi:hypothetical protein
MVKFYFTGILMVLCWTLSAQVPEVDPMPVRLKGLIISAADELPVPYAHIINNRTHGGTTSNAEGRFTMEMLNVDSLAISSVGFFKEVFPVPANNYNDTVVVFRLKPVSFVIRQVDVTAEKQKVNMTGVPMGKPVDIPVELRGDAYNERPPIIAAFFNPISYWAYYLSKSERRKRDVREAILLEKNWELHSQNYNKEVVMSLTGLNNEQADEFMLWFNAQKVLAYTSTEYEIRASIVEYFRIYQAEGRVKP